MKINIKKIIEEVVDLFSDAITKNIDFSQSFKGLRNFLIWLKDAINPETWFCQPQEASAEGKNDIKALYKESNKLRCYVKDNDEDHRHVFLIIAILKMAVWGQCWLSMASLAVSFIEVKIGSIPIIHKETLEYVIVFYACYFVLKWAMIATLGLVFTVFYDSRDLYLEITKKFKP